ncbi:Isoquinoline 1-oxidoreductase subunit [Caulobacter sp.]|uniref:Isoquinoline 1-oxidoreductase subunit n=1 Tax=Caulobacter sp. TaxID=78 RepID=UPI002B45EEE9|nr:Isoquinoline 1-oxidoreductase subunit [Caulobacter sp.]HJV41909.1 Isoquinoline 1-oxidoreductase subunit [Caulobacter sp.]
MRLTTLTILAGALALGGAVAAGTGQPSQPASAPEVLRTVVSFQSIRDPGARSVALFTEAGRVIQSPRCLNCHPVERRPTQGDDLHPHDPPMVAGDSGHGPAGMPCFSCHGSANVPTWGRDIQSIPGDPKWALAPVEMAWQGKSLGAICAQIKDPARNGGRSLDQIRHHMAEDHLVGWAWNPGAGRRPAPGSQRAFGDLIAAWIDAGARCPSA